MCIEAVNGELEYGLNELEKNNEGSDGHRAYILLEKGEYGNQCCKNTRMKELGIEKISFEVYQLAEKKLFNMDFKVAAAGEKPMLFHFHNKVASVSGYLDFFAEVENAATNVGASGLATFANQAAVLASRHQLPPDKSSAYLRCMDWCDDMEFELFRFLCYLLCLKADDTPGS